MTASANTPANNLVWPQRLGAPETRVISRPRIGLVEAGTDAPRHVTFHETMHLSVTHLVQRSTNITMKDNKEGAEFVAASVVRLFSAVAEQASDAAETPTKLRAPANAATAPEDSSSTVSRDMAANNAPPAGHPSKSSEAPGHPVVLISILPNVPGEAATHSLQAEEALSLLSASLTALRDLVDAATNKRVGTPAGKAKIGPYTFLPTEHSLLRADNSRIELTKKETAILSHLVAAKGGLVLREDLLTKVWRYSPSAYSHTVETHVYRLRKKLAADSCGVPIIATGDGGYYLSGD